MKYFLITISIFLTLLSNLYAQEIKSVNFTQEGEVSKLVIETSGEVLAERFSVTEDKQIILDLKNVKADRKHLRAIDTSEFDGATVFVSGYQKPGSTNDIRFAIQLRDNVRSILETTSNKIILSIENRFGVFSKAKVAKSEESIKTISDDSKEDVDTLKLNVPKSNSMEDILENLTLSGPKKYIGKKISINVKEIAVPELLKMISETSGFNIIIDKEVSTAPPLTLSLANIPWDQVLDTILTLSQLVASKNSNILSVKTLAQATAQAKAEADAAVMRRGLEPMVTKVFLISYAELPAMTTILQGYITPERGTIQTDNRTNSIIVKDTIDVIERVKKIIEVLDTQTPQILIEAKVVEADEAFSKNIGLNSGLNFTYNAFSPISSLATAGTPGFGISTAPSLNNSSFLSGNFSIKRLSNVGFNLNLMEREKKGRVISSPKVITQNKKAAKLTSSEERYFNTQAVANGVITNQLTPITAAIDLDVTPHVTNEGAVSMAIKINKQGFAAQDDPAAPPSITSRAVETNVLVDNGSTVVLGGMYATSTTESHSGVPFLKDIPLLGWLFRTPYNPDTSKTELIIFITPRIINQEQAGFTQGSSI